MTWTEPARKCMPATDFCESCDLDHRHSHEDLFRRPDWFWLLAPVVEAQGFQPQFVKSSRGAVLPLMERPRWYGRELSALANYYTSLYAPLGESLDGLEEIAASLRCARPHYVTLNLPSMDVEQTYFEALERELRNAGWWIQRYFCFGNWYLPCQGVDFETYFRSLSSRVRNSAKRKKKKFERIPGASVELCMSEDGLERAIEAYQQVYSHSWKVDEPFPNFIENLMRWAASNGYLRLGTAWIDDRPIAAQIWFVVSNKAYIFKLAYDERFKEHSAGTILTMHLMQRVLDVDKVSEVDYLTGDDAYKRDWMSHRRERWGVLGLNPRSPVAWLLAVRHLLPSWIKKVLGRQERACNGAAP